MSYLELLQSHNTSSIKEKNSEFKANSVFEKRALEGVSFSNMAAACPSDTELEERGDCDSTFDNVEEIGLGERRWGHVLEELGEEGGCHEELKEDWKSKALGASENILNNLDNLDNLDLENFDTDYFNYFNIENSKTDTSGIDFSSRFSSQNQEDEYKFNQDNTVRSQFAGLSLNSNESLQTPKENMSHAGKNYEDGKDMEKG